MPFRGLMKVSWSAIHGVDKIMEEFFENDDEGT
jgi:hypothetical protein